MPSTRKLTDAEREFFTLVAHVKESLAERPGREYAWPGNVRELEQAIRRILLNRVYEGDDSALGRDTDDVLRAGIDDGSLTAQELLSAYCALLYKRYRSYVDVSRITGLDRRTVKKYIEDGP